MKPLWIPALLVGAALGWAALDREDGVPAWLRLRADLRDAQVRMEVLRGEIAEREREARALRDDSFAIEQAIRRDLGFARPGETVVLVPGSDVSSLRIP